MKARFYLSNDKPVSLSLFIIIALIVQSKLHDVLLVIDLSSGAVWSNNCKKTAEEDLRPAGGAKALADRVIHSWPLVRVKQAYSHCTTPPSNTALAGAIYTDTCGDEKADRGAMAVRVLH